MNCLRSRPSSLETPSTRHFAACNRAFTLVEILIAMGILSLVLAAIYSSWTAILRASKAGNDAAAAVQRARMAGRTIEESLSSTLFFIPNTPYYSFVAENGDDASLSFVSRLANSFPRQGRFEGFDVRRVTFSLEQARDGTRQLVLRQCPLLMEMDIDEKEHPLVLANHVKEFKSEFWEPRTEEWKDEWKTTNQLPQMVKVTLTLSDPKNRSRETEQITRIVSLPSVAVSSAWQSPRVPNIPGQPGQPGQPGGVPGQIGQPGVIQPGVKPPGAITR